MEIREDIQKDILNSQIKRIYRTKIPDNTFWFEGLGNLESYKIIVELNNNKSFLLSEDEITRWDTKDSLLKLNSNKDKFFKGINIKGLIIDKQYHGVYLHLENDFVIYHSTFFGSKLEIEKYEEIFNEEGELL